MNAPSSPVQTVASVAPVPAAEIDRTCAAPVFLLALSALKWLVIASIFGILAAVKLVSPSFLAHCPWLTYGRVQPAWTHLLLYGFATQAALALALWLTARLGRTWLQHSRFALVGTLFWNLGVFVGLIAILAGHSTGYEWLEMPRYAAVILFASYALIAFSGLMTVHARRQDELYVTQWFIIAALFWFPWIFSTAQILLNFFPARGAMQAVVNWWYMNNFSTIWLGFIAIGTIFYFEPKLRGNLLHSRQLAWLAFWFLALFGSWGGVPASAPVPVWIRSLSLSGTILSGVGIIAVAVNIYKTCGGSPRDWLRDNTLRFLMLGAASFVVGGAYNILNCVRGYRQLTQFTYQDYALAHVSIYGVFAMCAFGAFYYILPKLINVEWPSPKMIQAHWLAALGGTVLIVLGLSIAGTEQGLNLNDPSVSFASIVASTKLGLQLNLLGQLVLAAGHAIALGHLCWLCLRCPCAPRCDLKSIKAWALKSQEVAA